MTNSNYDRPAGYDGQALLNAVRQYYLDSYGNIREKSANTLEMIHDAFRSLSYWDGWQRPPQYQGVALDTHVYQILTNDVSPLVQCMMFQDRIDDHGLDLLGRSAIAVATHSHYVRPRYRPRELQPKPAMDDRWGVDTCYDRLREVLQRTGHRRAI